MGRELQDSGKEWDSDRVSFGREDHELGGCAMYRSQLALLRCPANDQ